MQQRLAALDYWLGRPDGVFGDTTRQAVYAIQKAAGIAVDGVVGPATRAALDRGVRPEARSGDGAVVEVNIERRLLLIVTDGQVTAVLNTSTGGGYTYVENGDTHVARTPTGHFTVSRRIDGWSHSPLGWLWRPAYFYGGYAIHGYESVPPFPASHGCVRVSMAAVDWLWATGALEPGQQVWVY